MAPRRLPVILVLLASTAAGCGSGSSRSSTRTTDTSTSSTAAPSTAAPSTTTPAATVVPATSSPPGTTVDPLAGAGTAPVSAPAAGGGTALMTAVRPAGHPGFDRIVFEFTGPVPGYQVRYVDRPVREDGSGKEVSVSGASVLQVRMEPASGFDLSASGGHETYSGPARLSPTGTAVVRELVRTGDFEGALTWVVGLRDRAAFKVTKLTGPPRLVIDLKA